ncbi:MAG: bifunctional biotin--[acetyl-CoA-carboxylase] ligase/biotin operon repressor BirA [Kangiellaceae bacterium]|nr:bifunctional biotin--[acetyl-CoA-carboxylase] ligase/biotin operon repressor BirA [Kangiellaceae bacterium]
MSEHKDNQLQQVLSLLADGEFHSGQGIAEHLSVSRAYIWKLMQQLQELGLDIESVTRKGYRLAKPLSLLDHEALNRDTNFDCQVLLTTDSTNQQLKGQNFAHHKVVTAEYQSAGRGRRGRQWVSPLASNLYWSLGWQTHMPVQQLGGLSLVVGLAVANALTKLDIQGIELKWPNDIRYHGKKVGGILIELSGDAVGGLQVIIGVGLNIDMHPQAAQAIEQQWCNVNDIFEQQALPKKSRQQILIACLTELENYLQTFEAYGFAGFLDEWQQKDECMDKKVVILQADKDIKGIGAGVDATGAFLLQTGKGIKPIYAGEVSLRLRE